MHLCKFLLLSICLLPLTVSSKTILSMGTTHGCFINSQSRLFCFGSGGEGQIGNGQRSQTDKPVEISSLGEVISVDMHGSVMGDNNTCAVTKLGKVFCWGSNTYGILAKDSYDLGMSEKPVEIPDVSGAKQVVVGYGHACVLIEGNIIKCWGANGYGQLGEHSGSNSLTPIAINGLPAKINKLYAGHSHNCVIAEEKLYCWGANNLGQIGQGIKSDDNTTKPTLVNIPGKVLVADLYTDTSCVGTDNGAYCWGDTDNLPDILGQGLQFRKVTNEDEQITVSLFKPMPVGGLSGKIDDIVIRRADACALSAGKVYCWGANTSPNAHSDDQEVSRCLPETVSLIPGLEGVALSADNYELCVVKADDKISCWGFVPMCTQKKLLTSVKIKNLM